jgi:hypothetical protein
MRLAGPFKAEADAGSARCMRRLDLGAPPHVVRETAGHPDTEVTMTIYAHVSLEEKCKTLGKPGEVRSADAVAVKRGEPTRRSHW